MCFLMSLTLFHKHDTANRIYATINMKTPIKASALPDVWNIFQENHLIFIYTYSHIYSVIFSLWKEVQDIKKRMLKSTNILLSVLHPF